MGPIFPTAPIRPASCLAVPFLMAALAAAHGADARPKVAVAAFGLYGDQSVFESEATRTAKIVAERFAGSSVSIHANTRSREDANLESIATTLQSASETMDADNDVLVVILTSHGSRAGLEVKAGSHEEVLSPLALIKALDETPARVAVGRTGTRGVEIGHAFAERTTFIVTSDGKIADTIGGLPPDKNVEQALQAVQQLAKSSNKSGG